MCLWFALVGVFVCFLKQISIIHNLAWVTNSLFIQNRLLPEQRASEILENPRRRTVLK